MSFNIAKNTSSLVNGRCISDERIKINHNPINYNTDSYSSPSHITVNKTKDFDDFLLKICKSNKIKKSTCEKIKKELFIKNKSPNKIIFKSSRTLKISLLESQMNIIFKDSLLKNDSVNNFAFASEMKVPINYGNTNNFNNSESNNYSQNPNSIKHLNNFFFSENFTNEKQKIKNQNAANDENYFINSSLIEKAKTAIRSTINTNDSINIQANKQAIIWNGNVNKAEENRSTIKKTFEFHSTLNKNSNHRYLGIDFQNAKGIEYEDSHANNLFDLPKEFENKNLNINLETPESNISLNTVDRGFAFLNSCNLPNLDALKLNNCLNNDEIGKAQENRLKKDYYNVDTKHAIKNESCSFYYNINSSADFLKSLKLNNCFRNFLCSDHLIIQSNNFSILADKREEGLMKLGKQANSVIDPINFKFINSTLGNEIFKNDTKENISKINKKANKKKMIRILIQMMLTSLFFIFVFFSHIIRKNFKNKLKCLPLERKNENSPYERNLKILYKSNLQEFNGFIID